MFNRVTFGLLFFVLFFHSSCALAMELDNPSDNDKTATNTETTSPLDVQFNEFYYKKIFTKTLFDRTSLWLCWPGDEYDDDEPLPQLHYVKLSHNKQMAFVIAKPYSYSHDNYHCYIFTKKSSTNDYIKPHFIKDLGDKKPIIINAEWNKEDNRLIVFYNDSWYLINLRGNASITTLPAANCYQWYNNSELLMQSSCQPNCLNIYNNKIVKTVPFNHAIATFDYNQHSQLLAYSYQYQNNDIIDIIHLENHQDKVLHTINSHHAVTSLSWNERGSLLLIETKHTAFQSSIINVYNPATEKSRYFSPSFSDTKAYWSQENQCVLYSRDNQSLSVISYFNGHYFWTSFLDVGIKKEMFSENHMLFINEYVKSYSFDRATETFKSLSTLDEKQLQLLKSIKIQGNNYQLDANTKPLFHALPPSLKTALKSCVKDIPLRIKAKNQLSHWMNALSLKSPPQEKQKEKKIQSKDSIDLIIFQNDDHDYGQIQF